eukprot:Skav218994  [mRNA]  locus=scaffold169:242267:246738:- [translate_table: standard]
MRTIQWSRTLIGQDAAQVDEGEENELRYPVKSCEVLVRRLQLEESLAPRLLATIKANPISLGQVQRSHQYPRVPLVHVDLSQHKAIDSSTAQGHTTCESQPAR